MDLNELEALLSSPQETESECVVHNVPEQFGPLRHFDTTMRCASRGCSSPTHFKLKGIPYCMIHCMRKMNVMLQELGVEK